MGLDDVRFDDDLLTDHWFFKYRKVKRYLSLCLPESFLCDFCGQHLARHAYTSEPVVEFSIEEED